MISEKEKLDKPERLLNMLYNIFYETTRYPGIFEEYLKLMLNSISGSDIVKKAFLLNFNNQKDSFLVIILNYFYKNLNNLNNNPNFELFIKFLKSFFQSKTIINNLIKLKFVESLIADLDKSKLQLFNYLIHSVHFQKVFEFS